MLRDYLNQFSDRWPDEYHNLYHEIKDSRKFQSAVLWKLLKWARPDREDSMEIYDLIVKLESDELWVDVHEETGLFAKTRYEVKIEDISDGKL